MLTDTGIPNKSWSPNSLHAQPEESKPTIEYWSQQNHAFSVWEYILHLGEARKIRNQVLEIDNGDG